MTGLGGAAIAGLIAEPALAEIENRIIRKTGFAFYADRRGDLAAKVDARMRALGLNSYDAYLERLKGPFESLEWDALIEEVTIGETYFFRYPAQWEALRDIVLSSLLATKGKSELRIWSAGCANGAEVYSLAMVLQKDLACRFQGWDISILGTDICKTRLRQATRGAYGEWELRAIPEEYRRECFHHEGSSWNIRDELKRFVKVELLNLIHDTESFALRNSCAFDIILCRNVMIYFSAEQSRMLLKQFHHCLKEGGWFITGHSEPYLEISNVFHPHAVPGAMLYRKQGGPRERAPVDHEASRFEPATSKIFTRARAPKTPSLPVERSHSVKAPGPAQGHELDRQTQSLDGVRRLANTGSWNEASLACARYCAANPLDPEAHFLMALLHEHRGESDAAAGALGRALYIDAEFALAHYHAAMESAARLDLASARRSLRNVFKSLRTAQDTDLVLSGDGLTAGELRDLTKLQSRILEGKRS
ncbi:MAG: protein-glutamate O-methyltransferase CheR [Parvularculaceae bacterium]